MLFLKKHQEESADSSSKIFEPKFPWWPLAIVFSSLILATAWIFTATFKTKNSGPKPISLNSQKTSNSNSQASDEQTLSSQLAEKVLPSSGVTLPAKWGDLGVKLMAAGAIDQAKWDKLYQNRGVTDGQISKLWLASDNGNLTISPENSGVLLNLLWALGLANKNEILESGPMVDERYGGAGNFASTGGWTLAKGKAMDHYSQHRLITLTSEQQQLVQNVSQNIYRPCCGNSVYFPDCNHGMAMLGLLELMASQGAGEAEMYQAALQVNAYWFPDTYLTIAKYLPTQGRSWEATDPKEILGYDYSSASGYRQIVSKIEPAATQGGGGCGI